MNKSSISLLAAVILGLSTAALVPGQTETKTTTTTVSKTVQNPDGTYSVVEYPVGKEVTVTLNPVAIAGANGTATILRDDTGTKIKLNLTGLPAETTAVNLYAVDPSGAVTLLGPIEVANGTGTFAATTPLTKFMLVASPEAGLSTYDTNTKVIFRSAVPTGFAVIPLTSPAGEKVAAVTTPGTTPASTYTVPMLNIPNFKKGDETKLKVNFSGELSGTRANIFIEPHKRAGGTEVRMRFHDLKEAPVGKVYTLWAVSPDNKFSKLGQIVNAKARNEAEIKSETTLTDFGLLLTMEDAGATGEAMNPAGPSIGVVEVIK